MSSPIKTAYDAANTGNGGITSLASSATWVVGYQWFYCDNTTLLSLDRELQGTIRVGTSPTVNTELRLYAVSSYDGGTTWPDVFTSAAGAKTITSENVRNGFAKLVWSQLIDATSNRDYSFSVKLAAWFNGSLPKKVCLFVTHNTGVALNATAGQHIWADQPIYANAG